MKVKSRFLNNFLNNPDHQYQGFVMLILFMALLMRISGLGFSYSNDELSALIRVRFDSFSDLVSGGFYVDGHPGGIQVFLYYWVKLFGMGEWAVRFPFALAGVGAVYFAIRVFGQWFGKTSGLLTGVFIAFLEFPLVYSQIARPYGAGLLFAMMMTHYWTRLLFDEKPRASLAVSYALSAAACMYTHYFCFLLALIAGITGLFYLTRRSALYYLGAGLGAALLFSPHIYITLNHLGIGGVGLWLAKPENNWLLKHILYIFNDSVLLVSFAIAVLLTSLFYSYRKASFSRYHLFAVLFFFLPFLIGFFYSRMVNPVLQHSVLIFSFPFLVAFLFSFTANLPSRPAAVLILVILVAGPAHTIGVNHYYRKQHFGEFKKTAILIDQWNRQYGEKNITRAISVNNPWYINFYSAQTPGGITSFAQYENRGGLQLDTLARILDTASTPYFMYAWTKMVPAETEDLIRARFPYIIEKVDFEGLSAATLYAREGSSKQMSTADTTLRIDLTASEFDMSSTEFSPGYSGPVPSGRIAGKASLVASVEVYADTIPAGALLVFDFKNEQGETSLWQGSRMELFCKPGHWSKVRLTVSPGEEILSSSQLKVYLWNPRKATFVARNLRVSSE